MRRAISIMMSCALLMAASECWANERVRAFVAKSEASEDTFVGQKVNIIVEVLSETHFSGATRIDLPDIAGAVFYKPEERAVVGSKEMDGKTFSTQRHELAFYAQRAGSFEIPSLTVRFGVAGVGGEKATEYKNQTQAIQIKTVMPPGTEKLTRLITATDLKVTEVWNPQPNKEFIAGNAIKRKITFTAPDIPGMVFPKIHIAQMDGLKIYRDRATIHDKINRGSLIGERVDTLTYVCQSAGTYQLPAIQIQWWDLSSGQLKTIQLPDVRFKVKPSPHQNSNVVLAARNRPRNSWKSLLGGGMVLVVIGFMIFKFRGAILNQFTLWKTHWTEGEPAYFKRIETSQTPPEILNAIHQWLQKLAAHTKGQTLTHFANEHGHQDLRDQFGDLQRATVSPDIPWDKAQIIIALKRTRKNILRENTKLTNSTTNAALKPLNPKDHLGS
jgi:hypothetical protein